MLFFDNNNCLARTCEAYWLHTTQTDNLPSTMLPGHDTFSIMTAWQAIRSEYCDWPTVCHLSICLSVTIPHYGQTVQGKQCWWSIYGKLIIRLQNPQQNDIEWPWRGHSKVTKVKIERTSNRFLRRRLHYLVVYICRCDEMILQRRNR